MHVWFNGTSDSLACVQFQLLAADAVAESVDGSLEVFDERLLFLQVGGARFACAAALEVLQANRSLLSSQISASTQLRQ